MDAVLEQELDALVAASAGGGTGTRAEALARVAGLVEEREGAVARRAAGSYFTAPDVCAWIVARTLLPAWARLAGLGELERELDAATSSGDDPRALVAAWANAADGGGLAHAARSVRELRVLDPACGAGAFLVAAWDVLVRLADLLEQAGAPSCRPVPGQLHGIDVDPRAVAACRAALRIAVGSGRDAAEAEEARVGRGDLLDEVPGELAGQHVLVGNPPFVRRPVAAAPAGMATARCGNLAAWIVERAIAACAAPGARIGMVLPISVACTDAWASAREHWGASCSDVWASHWDTIPASLFPHAVQRVSILLGAVSPGRDQPARWHTSRYHRFTRAERAGVLERVRHVPAPRARVGTSLAKVGSGLEARLLERLHEHPPAGRLHAPRGSGGDNHLLYKRRWSYFLLFTDREPPVWDASGAPRSPSECRRVDVVDGFDARALLAAYSSTLFWWWFSAFTDNRNVNRRELAAFPLPASLEDDHGTLATFGRQLLERLHACAEVRECTYRSVGTIRNTYYRQGATRAVLDEVDAELAVHVGMSDAELDAVLAYERRFRS